LIYPGSTPEFRFLQKENGTFVLQLRYVNISVGYISKWQDVPVVKEDQQE